MPIDLERPEEKALAACLDHEKLDVYQRALEFAAFAHGVVPSSDKSCAHLADQIRRASSSIVLNIAEGAGRIGRADKARFYKIATGSATECSATIDLLYKLNRIPLADYSMWKMEIRRVVGALINLTKSVEER